MNWIIWLGLLFLGFIILFAISLSKQKKGEVLLIEIVDNVVNFYLSDDKYLSIDISDIKNDKEKVYGKIKEVIKSRAFELKNLINKVQFFKDEDKKKEEELLFQLKMES